MSYFYVLSSIVVAIMLASGSAQACRVSGPTNFSNVQAADAVVVGKIINYKIVLDLKTRNERTYQLSHSPNMSPEYRRFLSKQKNFDGDYARFDVVVEKVLKGNVGRKIRVTWNASPFAEPDHMTTASVVVALTKNTPTNRARSEAKSDEMIVFQPNCDAAFIFPKGSREAESIFNVLTRHSK